MLSRLRGAAQAVGSTVGLRTGDGLSSTAGQLGSCCCNSFNVDGGEWLADFAQSAWGVRGGSEL
jgi:hypothetical protein